ncbi:hypothetical protein NPIL_336271 [Nephila pilipes]|uniref:Uncharacterized protein n=1 Tax=Nephila pilipes TaxID=299642 RepID=A0A8X6TP10_NEPPI|nr:hypothetical protein NPIL_336271 [Nephila pilipes]
MLWLQRLPLSATLQKNVSFTSDSASEFASIAFEIAEVSGLHPSIDSGVIDRCVTPDRYPCFSDSQAAILAIANCSHGPSSVFVMQSRSLMGKMV